MLKSILGLAASACLLVGLTAERASADLVYVYTLGSNTNSSVVNFKNSLGTLTGAFTTNENRSALISASIAVSAVTSGNKPFDAITYTLANFSLNESKHLNGNSSNPFTRLVFNSVDSQGDPTKLTLDFSPNALGITGRTDLSQGSSDEKQDKARNVDKNAWVSVVGVTVAPPVAAVPEPSALAVAAICAPALLVYARRRRKGMDAA